jgi:hypothetical protein
MSKSIPSDQKSETTLKRLVDNGIPVAKVEFVEAVINGFNTPEKHLTSISDNKSRKCDNMYWTTAGLICFQNDKWFCSPEGNIRYVHFK